MLMHSMCASHWEAFIENMVNNFQQCVKNYKMTRYSKLLQSTFECCGQNSRLYDVNFTIQQLANDHKGKFSISRQKGSCSRPSCRAMNCPSDGCFCIFSTGKCFHRWMACLFSILFMAIFFGQTFIMTFWPFDNRQILHSASKYLDIEVCDVAIQAWWSLLNAKQIAVLMPCQCLERQAGTKGSLMSFTSGALFHSSFRGWNWSSESGVLCFYEAVFFHSRF